MPNLSIQLIVKLLQAIIVSISPQLKDYLKKMLKELEEKSITTSNPFDDLLVELLKYIFP